jgi:hypothetical protein
MLLELAELMLNKYIPEGIVWLEISKYYKVELLDKPMRYYHANNEGLMIHNSKFISNLKGKILLNEQLENFIEKFFFKNIVFVSKILINKAVILLLVKKNLFSNIKKFSYITKIFYFFLLPIAFVKFLYVK